MKLREWDKIKIVSEKDPEKQLKTLTLLKPSTIERLKTNKDLMNNSIDITYFRINKMKKVLPYCKLQDPFNNIVLIDVITTNIFFKLKEKVKTDLYKLKKWFTTIVSNEPFSINIKD